MASYEVDLERDPRPGVSHSLAGPCFETVPRVVTFNIWLWLWDTFPCVLETCFISVRMASFYNE